MTSEEYMRLTDAKIAAIEIEKVRIQIPRAFVGYPEAINIVFVDRNSDFVVLNEVLACETTLVYPPEFHFYTMANVKVNICPIAFRIVFRCII